jgi:hypothetical protein
VACDGALRPIYTLDMPDDLFDDDAARDAALDYEDEAQLSGRHYYDRTTKRRSTSEKGRMKEGASLRSHQIGRSIRLERFHYIVTYDMAKTEFWEHGQTELDFFLRKIYSLSEMYGHTEDLDNVVALLCDRDSHLYQVFQRIVKKTNHREFSAWLTSFLYSSRRSGNFGKLCKDKRTDTSDFMSAEEYNAIWRKIKEHGTTSNVSEKAWEMFQASFNTTMKDNFLPDRANDQLKPQLCTDDDKMLRHHQALRNIVLNPNEEDGICRQHHTRDNRKSLFTLHSKRVVWVYLTPWWDCLRSYSMRLVQTNHLISPTGQL